jgi:restriction endonuclease S subunit
MGQSPDGSTYSDEPSDYILVQGNADLQNGWVCPRIWTTQITKKADAGDLIMSVRAPAGAMGKTAYNAVIGRGVAAIKGNEFIYQLLVKMDADGFWKTLSCGSTFESLNSDNIKNAEVKIPTTAEQIKIGGYFQQLDNLITLHQRQPFSHSTPDISLSVQLIHPFYTSSWEQRKAIDIADYSKGNGYSKGDLTDAGTPIILYGRLYTKYQFAISEVDTFAVPRNGAVYSQGNEVIVPASGETAEDIARASAVEKSGVLLGGDLNILRPFDFINPLFLALAISNGEPQKELAKKAQGKSVVHIHNTDIQEVTIAYPSRTEQDRIVSVFRQLDNLITLHQRKGKAAVSGCSNDANNSKGVCCKARDFGYKCHKKDEPNRFDA